MEKARANAPGARPSGVAQTIAHWDIRADPGLRPHAETDFDVVRELMRRYRLRLPVPPIVVFFDKRVYWLADGHHRLFAWRLTTGKSYGYLQAVVRRGSRRDAMIYAASRRAGRRNLDDQRRAIRMLLSDPVWAERRSNVIYQYIGTSEALVNAERRAMGAPRDLWTRRKIWQPKTYEERKMARKPARDEQAVTVEDMENLLESASRGEALAGLEPLPDVPEAVRLPEPSVEAAIKQAEQWAMPSTRDPMMLLSHLESAQSIMRELQTEIRRLRRSDAAKDDQIAALQSRLQSREE